MAVTADIQPVAAPKYAAAYLIGTDVAVGIERLLVGVGYQLDAAAPSAPGQIPRYTVSGYRSYSHRMADTLTEREMQVLLLISHGQSNPEIGGHLHLSEDTVKTHCRRLFRKLDVRDRAHAVARGYERGLLGQAATS
ncbi:response regulator transcription factor [Amycolatopsis heterodermiae]